VHQPQAVNSQYGTSFRLQRWVKRNTPLLLVAGLLLISLGVVLIRR